MAHEAVSIRVLVPITSTGFREADLAQAFAGEAFGVSTAFLSAGPVSVESAIDEVMAGPGIIEGVLQAEAEGCDAVVIDCMLDPALDAAREAVRIPVIGCGETAMRQAVSDAGPFSVVTVLDRQDRLFHEKARHYGIEERLCSVRAIDLPVLGLKDDWQRSLDLAVNQSLKAVREDGARAIVFGCTGMMGLGDGVAQALEAAGVGVPVYDPLPLAVAEANRRVVAGERHEKALYPEPERKPLTGMTPWPALYRVFDQDGGVT